MYIYIITISLVPIENQASTQKTAKKRGRKKKQPIVEDNEPMNNDNQQNIASVPKTTAKCKTAVSTSKTTAKRKAVSAPKTNAKRNRKETEEPAVINEDEDVNIQDSKGSDEDINTQETVAAVNASISKFLEISDDDDNVSEGNFFKIIF